MDSIVKVISEKALAAATMVLESNDYVKKQVDTLCKEYEDDFTTLSIRLSFCAGFQLAVLKEQLEEEKWSELAYYTQIADWSVIAEAAVEQFTKPSQKT